MPKKQKRLKNKDFLFSENTLLNIIMRHKKSHNFFLHEKFTKNVSTRS